MGFGGRLATDGAFEKEAGAIWTRASLIIRYLGICLLLSPAVFLFHKVTAVHPKGGDGEERGRSNLFMLAPSQMNKAFVETQVVDSALTSPPHPRRRPPHSSLCPSAAPVVEAPLPGAIGSDSTFWCWCCAHRHRNPAGCLASARCRLVLGLLSIGGRVPSAEDSR